MHFCGGVPAAANARDHRVRLLPARHLQGHHRGLPPHPIRAVQVQLRGKRDGRAGVRTFERRQQLGRHRRLQLAVVRPAFTQLVLDSGRRASPGLDLILKILLVTKC